MLNEYFTIRCPRCYRREVIVLNELTQPECYCTDCGERFPYDKSRDSSRKTND